MPCFVTLNALGDRFVFAKYQIGESQISFLLTVTLKPNIDGNPKSAVSTKPLRFIPGKPVYHELGGGSVLIGGGLDGMSVRGSFLSLPLANTGINLSTVSKDLQTGQRVFSPCRFIH